MAEILKPVEPEYEKVADRLISRFGSLPAVFAAPPRSLHLLASATSAAWIELMVEALGHSLRWDRTRGEALPSTEAVARYLSFGHGHAERERVRVLYLDINNRLLADEVVAEGTIDSAPFHVREIIGRAIELRAAALVVAHNHPSGDTTPSRSDIEATRSLSVAAKACEIPLLDHFIVAGSQICSMRALGRL